MSTDMDYVHEIYEEEDACLVLWIIGEVEGLLSADVFLGWGVMRQIIV